MRIAAFSLLALATCSSPVYAAAAKPNIVFILADDLGYGDLGCYGQTKIRQLLKRGGYATAIVGKWGLGMPEDHSSPLDYGFDHHFGYLCQGMARQARPVRGRYPHPIHRALAGADQALYDK